MNDWTEHPREAFDRITEAIDDVREGGMVVVSSMNEGLFIVRPQRPVM